MTLKDLGEILEKMYYNAPKGSKILMVQLFGIKYADKINKLAYSYEDIAEQANISRNHGFNISTGIKLTEFVTLNDDAII
ncbi:MAG: hypothetical protein ABJK28_09265 [Algibacter sp.]